MAAVPLEPTVRLVAIVRGRVQGVGFRYFVVREATRRGLVGYTRNLPDGGVEVVAEGGKRALRGLEEALRSGPPTAIVRHVAVDYMSSSGEFTRFEVRY